MEKIGLFGGTFDPPHIEHENILKKVKEQFSLDDIIVLPSGNPPHKKDVTGCKHRFNMAKLAFKHVDDFEIKNGGKSYTYITLEHFKRKDRQLFFIVGQDSLDDIKKWKEPERILSLCQIICVGRGGKAFTQLPNILLCNEYCDDISSTDIRITLEYGLDCKQLNSSVRQYIKENGLYKRYAKYVAAAKEHLDDKRFTHTVNTTITAFELAKIHDIKIDRDELFIATCLHDAAKNLPKKRLREIAKDNSEKINEKILHQDAGGIFAKSLFPDISENITRAIEKHTTFASGMTDLEKLVALSDSIERSRNYDGVEEIREIAKKDINKAILMCIENIIKRESAIDNRTLSAKEYFKEITYGR